VSTKEIQQKEKNMAKTIWARIGMSLTVSDEEYDKLKKDVWQNGS